jgi:hypothetical protein
MKTLSITALALMSTSAFATDARVAAHQDNAGINDDTAYRTYFSRTDNGKDSMWFDLSAGGVLEGSYKADGKSMTLAQSATGSTAIGYYSADGDAGYGVTLDVTSKKNIALGGGYGTTNGDTDMAFGGNLAKTEAGTNVTASIASRTLTKKEVSAWGADLGYVDKAITVDGGYDMGWRFKTDRSKAAVTLGPQVGVVKPEEGDMSIDLTLAEFNIAGEFALNDWFGLRGSVVSGLEAVIPMGGAEFDIHTTGVSPMFGASIDFEGADIDLVIDPNNVMNGPYFLTGATSNPAMMMSARFDI